MRSVVTRFTPAQLAAWLLALTTLFAPLSATTRAQVIEDNANGQTQEADALGLAHDTSEDAGEETGGGTLGAAAIWSHRWQAWYNFAGVTGPSFNKDGGVEFGGGWGANPNGGTFGASGAAVQGVNTASAAAATVQNAHPVNHTGIFVGDYTIQPENGGLGVFAHEYGHDLGLPDHYDRNGGANAAGFWTIMSSGSYLGDGQTDIGSRPGDFGAWDKLQLGWLNYEVADPSKNNSLKLGPAETNTKQAQAVVVPLPQDKNVFYLYDPAAGSLQYGTKAWWGGKGDLLDNTMTRTMTVPAAPATLTMRLNYQIETNWDYAYVSVSNNGGATWTNLVGTYLNGAVQSALTTSTNPNGSNLGNGITGTSNGAWRLASFNLTPYAGQTVQLRLRYKTDPFTSQRASWPTRSRSAHSRTAPSRATTVGRSAASRRRTASRVRTRRTTTSPSTGSIAPTMRGSRPARTASATRSPSRTGLTTTRIRTACSSGTGTRAWPTTTRRCTAAKGSCSPWTRIPSRSAASSPTTA